MHISFLSMDKRPKHSDHVYATKSGVPISLRVWPASDISTPAPFLLWIHGGAFCFALFTDVADWVVPAFTGRGYHVVSADFRITPCANIEHMLEDMTDAFTWCQQNLPKLPPEGSVDVCQYVVGGDSAGACIAALLALKLKIPPRAVLIGNGLMDLSDPHFDNIPRNIELSGKFTVQQIKDKIASRDLSEAVTEVPSPAAIEQLGVEGIRRKFDRPSFEFTDARAMQLDCRALLYKHSGWVRAALHSERFATEDELRAYARHWSPYWLLNAEAHFPPTYFIHGEADTSVPIEHPKKMAKRLREMGVEVAEYYEPGQDHMFDRKFIDPGVQGWDKCVVACLEFMDRHVKGRQ